PPVRCRLESRSSWLRWAAVAVDEIGGSLRHRRAPSQPLQALLQRRRVIEDLVDRELAPVVEAAGRLRGREVGKSMVERRGRGLAMGIDEEEPAARPQGPPDQPPEFLEPLGWNV